MNREKMNTNKSSIGRILITGVNGFCGKHLSSYLSQENPEVEIFGIDINKNSDSLPDIKFIKSDITDYDSIKTIIAQIQPDTVFHLAGTFDYGDLVSLYKINVIGTENVMKAMGSLSKNVRLILASSAAVYGIVFPKDNPIDEEKRVSPVSHYGISKLAMEMIGKMHGQKNENLKIIIARTFNLIGQGLSPLLFPGKLAKQIFEVSRMEGKKAIHVGNIQTIRDFIDIKDAAKAFSLLAIHGKENDIYNIGSGEGRKIKELIDLFINTVDPSIEVIVDRNLYKEIDPEKSIADITKIKSHTEWVPQTTLEESVLDIIKLQSIS